MRNLKFHEQRLLRQTDFNNWTARNVDHAQSIVTRYQLSGVVEYKKYNDFVGLWQKIASKLKVLPQNDIFRETTIELLLKDIHRSGIKYQGRDNLKAIAKVSVSDFIKRRLDQVLLQLKMVKTLKDSQDLIEHGHVTIDGNVIRDLTYHISPQEESCITWADNSKIKHNIDNFSAGSL